MCLVAHQACKMAQIEAQCSRQTQLSEGILQAILNEHKKKKSENYSIKSSQQSWLSAADSLWVHKKLLTEVRLDKWAFHYLQDTAENILVFSGKFDTALNDITQYNCQSLTKDQLPAITPTYVFACSGWVVWEGHGKICEAISSTSF